MKWYILLIFVLNHYSGENVWATPKSVEMWFISPPKVSLSDPYIDGSVKIAQNDINYKNCRPMGENYCFHPQLGLIESNQPTIIPNVPEKKAVVEPPLGSKYLSNSDQSLISCDRGYYFDMFCGRASKRGGFAGGLEIWVDTSSSLRSVDFAKDGKSCYRRSFVKRVLDKCTRKKVSISTFNTSRKAMGGLDSLCFNYGLNNQDNIIRWIKASKSKKLLIITDVAELTMKLKDFLDSIGGKYLGYDSSSEILAREMIKLAPQVAKHCK